MFKIISHSLKCPKELGHPTRRPLLPFAPLWMEQTEVQVAFFFGIRNAA